MGSSSCKVKKKGPEAADTSDPLSPESLTPTETVDVAKSRSPDRYQPSFRHSGMGPIRSAYAPMRTHSYTAEKIQEVVGGHIITDLEIEGNLPANIGQLVPNVTNLRMRDISDIQSLSNISHLTKLNKLNISGKKQRKKRIRGYKTIRISDDIFSPLTELTELDMSYCGLSNLPKSLAQLSKLQKLNISRNKISSIPDDLFKSLPQLVELHMACCELSDLPESVSELTKLQVLDIYGNEFSLIPDGLFTSLPGLVELDINACKLSYLPESMSHLTKLQKLDISMNEISLIPDGLFTCLSELVELNMEHCELSDLPESMSQLTKLQKLYLSRNKIYFIPDGIFPCLRELVQLRMDSCELSDLPESMSQLTKLQVLNIANNRLSYIPEVVFSSLKDLTDLDMSTSGSRISSSSEPEYRGLTTLPKSISQLTKLRRLNLSGNSLSSIPEDIVSSSLTQLRKLQLASCGLSDLPKSISQLTKLDELNIANHRLSCIPEVVFSSLKELTFLDMSIERFGGSSSSKTEHPGLTTLPKSISQLTKLTSLNLSGNMLSSIPEDIVFSSLTQLRHLYMASCGLSDIPKSISNMANLTSLNMRDNQITHLPEHISTLKKLGFLYLYSNYRLKSLTAEILNMPQLKEIGTDHCSSLTAPPCEVCKQGISAIRQYYLDIEKTSSLAVPIATIAVIGQSMSGKTSLIRTLQNTEGVRELTNRQPDGLHDEATRVFQMEDVKVKNDILQFIDFGGNGIYHSTYQLTLKQNCIPVVVINMKEYSTLETNVHGNEAIRQLFFDWLSHLYLAYPDLGPPKLVLTHLDQFDTDTFAELEENLDFYAKSVYETIRFQEKKGRRSGAESFRIQHFERSEIFAPDDKYRIGDTYCGSFEKLKTSLYLESQKFVKSVPMLWKDIEMALQSLQQGFQKFDDIFEITSQKHTINKQQLEVILTYMHNCGKLLWYKEIETLKSYVFYQIPVITKLLHVLFTHNSNVWVARQSTISSTSTNHCELLNANEFRSLSQQFHYTGVMSCRLIHYLLKSETEFTQESDRNLAIEILKSFRLIYGPTVRDNESCYIIPHFCKEYLSDTITSRKTPINLHTELQFEGLALPQYMYHQLTVGLLNSYSRCTEVIPKNNGVKMIFSDHQIVQLTHDFKSRKVSIQVSTESSQICQAWKLLVEVTNSAISHVHSAWKSSRMVCIFICPHCQLKEYQHPERVRNPPWCILHAENGIANQISTQNQDSLQCKSDSDVPSCLKYPCDILSDDQMEKLKTYVDLSTRDLYPESFHSVDQQLTAVQVEGDDEEEGEISDTEEFPPAVGTAPIIISTCSTTKSKKIKQLYSNTNKIYKMSAPVRGRALIINNYNFPGNPESNRAESNRAGSNVDVLNLEEILKQLKFEVNVERDLSVQAMLSTISRETEHPHHVDYGMFILVLMSHGGANDIIYGSDAKSTPLSKMYELMKPSKFPSMGGKPKVIILQACRGAQRDGGLQQTLPAAAGSLDALPTPAQHTQVQPGTLQQPPQSPQLPQHQLQSQPQQHTLHLDVDDLFIFQSCFQSYVSVRNRHYGSLFIRTLVSTLHKHACHKDLCDIFDTVQHKVTEMSRARLQKGKGFGQVPVVTKTPTGMRKVYLFPGYNGD